MTWPKHGIDHGEAGERYQALTKWPAPQNRKAIQALMSPRQINNSARNATLRPFFLSGSGGLLPALGGWLVIVVAPRIVAPYKFQLRAVLGCGRIRQAVRRRATAKTPQLLQQAIGAIQKSDEIMEAAARLNYCHPAFFGGGMLACAGTHRQIQAPRRYDNSFQATGECQMCRM
jgi:hypothetical protein